MSNNFNIMENFNISNKNIPSGIPMTKVLLLFYIFIASGYTKDLMSKQMQTFISENRSVQHIIGFLLMMTIIILFGGVTNTYNIFIYSIIGYIWFLFTGKLDIHWNIIVILLLVFGFIYESNIDEKESVINSDDTLTQEQKDKLISKNTSIKSYIIISVLLVTFIGTFFYTNKKVTQYGGGNFDLLKYLFD